MKITIQSIFYKALNIFGSKQLMLLYAAFILLLHVMPVADITLALNEVPLLLPDPDTIPDLVPGEPLRIDQMEIATMRLDFLLHVVIFFPLMLLLWLYLNLSEKDCKACRPSFKRVLPWLTGAILFAAGTEAMQHFLFYRNFDFPDLLYNVLGILLGATLFLFRLPKRMYEIKGQATNASQA